MSGGGGGSGPPTVDPGPTCNKSYKGARLTSPKSDVVSTLHVGDKLELTISKLNGNPMLLATKNGQEAGSIMHHELSQIIRCIEEGKHYIALVIAIDGGNCSLEIKMEDSI